MAAVISVRNLIKEFSSDFWKKRVRVLKDVSFEVEDGDIFGFLGPNGAGKTTTLKTLVGLIFPTSGDIQIFGKPLGDLESKRRIGFLPENPYFYEYLKTEEFLEFYAETFGLSGLEKRKRVDELLDLVGMSKHRGLQLRKFSKGMLQRMGIAQALVNNPKLIILDEPQSGLDPIGRRDVRNIILRLKDEGKTIFFSSHIMHDVELVCEKVGIIVNGHMKDIGYIQDLIGTKILNYEVIFRESNNQPVQFPFEINKRRKIGGDSVVEVATEEQLTKAVSTILSHSGSIRAITPNKVHLEDLFIQSLGQTEKNESLSE